LNTQTGNCMAICHECDLQVAIAGLREGQKASCPRCGFVISRKHCNALMRMAIFSLTAMVALLFANLFTFITLEVQGLERSLTLLDSIQSLTQQDEWTLAGIIAGIVFFLPVVLAVALSSLIFSLSFGRVSARTILLLRLLEFFRFWNMAEIYFLGVLISIIKVVSLADIQLGPSFWFFGVFSVAQIAALLHIDKFQLAHQIRQRVSADKTAEVHGEPA
jgi:paraquat-inducible protein A